MLGRLATAEGRADLVTGGLVSADDMSACTDDDWPLCIAASSALDTRDAAGRKHAPVNSRVYCGIFSAQEATSAQLCAHPTAGSSAPHGAWDHPSLVAFRAMSSGAVRVLVSAMYMGYLTSCATAKAP